MNYPSPCETCDKQYGCRGCKDWEIRYRYRQAQINAYAKRACAGKIKPLPVNKFCYSHPNEVSRWLKESPCTGCNAEAVCETACPAYLRWYDARMQIARRRAYG